MHRATSLCWEGCSDRDTNGNVYNSDESRSDPLTSKDYKVWKVCGFA